MGKTFISLIINVTLFSICYYHNVLAQNSFKKQFDKPRVGLLDKRTTMKQSVDVSGSNSSTLTFSRDEINTQYLISPGDILEISVWGEPEMKETITVRPDGYISYFLIGDIKAEGKTIEKLKEEITRKLSKYIRAPHVTVIGRKFNSQKSSVIILGAVVHPGRYLIQKDTTLVDLIAMAGGFKYDYKMHAGYNLTASYFSRNNKLVPINFSSLFKKGDMSQNIRLQPGDFVYIASTEERSVYVLGAVRKPKKEIFESGMTLVNAIASAGGFAFGAKQSNVYIVSNGLSNPKVKKVNFSEIIKGNEQDICLSPGDIIYVPRSFLSKISELPNRIIPFLNVIIKEHEAF